MKNNYLIGLIFYVITFNCCVDSINFPTQDDVTFLSVSGTLHNLMDTQFVKINLSKGYKSTPVGVSNALVKVYDENNESKTYEEIRTGVYALVPNRISPSPFSFKPGKSYYIEIKTEDGKIYRSEPEIMPQPIVPDSISFATNDKDILTDIGTVRSEKILKILINTNLKNGNTDSYLRWNVEDAFVFKTIPECNPFKTVYTCYYVRPNMPSPRIILGDSKNFPNGKALGFAINEVSLEAVPPQFKFENYWRVHQFSISEKAHKYWTEIDLVSNQVGSILDVAPAYVKGNLYNVADKSERVLGYFEVASEARLVRSMTRPFITDTYFKVLDYETDLCKDFFSLPICCYCPQVEIKGWINTNQKPSYWR